METGQEYGQEAQLSVLIAALRKHASVVGGISALDEHPFMNYTLRLAIVAGLLLTSCAEAKQAGKILLMHYMPWYTTPAVSGEWGGHWRGWQSQHHPDQTTTNGLPDIWSHYHPLIGVYDSSDPDVLECQLLQMKLAGIDGVLAD